MQLRRDVGTLVRAARRLLSGKADVIHEPNWKQVTTARIDDLREAVDLFEADYAED